MQSYRSFKEAQLAVERSYVREALASNDWNMNSVARDIELPTSTLHDLVKKLSLWGECKAARQNKKLKKTEA